MVTVMSSFEARRVCDMARGNSPVSFLKQLNLSVFSMWANSVNTVGIFAQLEAAQFAKLALPRSVRELVTLSGARANAAEYEWVQHVAPSKSAASQMHRPRLEQGAPR